MKFFEPKSRPVVPTDDWRPVPFWIDALTFRDAVTVQIGVRVLIFTLAAVGLCLLNDIIPPDIGVGVAPYEVAGAALGLLLVLRTNSGYDRWWEGRRLWGAIVNQSRGLATAALAYGPDDPAWRAAIIRWTIAFGHVCRHSLRGQRTMPQVIALLGKDDAGRVAEARHMPTYVALEIARLLRVAYQEHGMDRLAFAQAESSRTLLIDHIGGCERILKTPLPRAYSINIRRFIMLFLGTLPFALRPKIGWLTPIATLLVAYPILSLDEIGVELQNPFSTRNLGHLPLDEICTNIEKDLLAIESTFPRDVSRDTLTRVTPN